MCHAGTAELIILVAKAISVVNMQTGINYFA